MSELASTIGEFITCSCVSRRTLLGFILGLTIFAAMGLSEVFWAPYLATELESDGVSPVDVGVIVSGYDLSGLLSSIYFMFCFKNIRKRKLLLCMGGVILGSGCILFGQLTIFGSETILVILSVLTRAIMGSGMSIIWCTGVPLLISMFPQKPGMVCSSITLATGIGHVLGGPVGSLFLRIGGFSLPFWVAGGLLVTLAIICYVCMPVIEEFENSNRFSLLSARTAQKFITNCDVCVIFIAALFIFAPVGFLSVGFGPHLKDAYNINSSQAGNYALPFTAIGALSNPISGYLSDKGFSPAVFTFLGCCLSTIGPLLIGVSQNLTNFMATLPAFEIYQCMTSFGSIATRATFIPLLRSIYCKHADQNFEVIDNYASIMCTLCYSFGIIFGQCFIGGFILERYGFYNCNYIMGSLCGISGLLAAVILVKEKLLFTRFPPMSIYQSRFILDADDTIEVDA
ncbi:MFS-type transporter SLC18B1-like [Convolutriloba macropyga]|uniref:MFS-type transporter SLC18B1-like n=1 Tax=Convolutriloba macropyga TaxID=536237 RepID=UPI003F51C7EE